MARILSCPLCGTIIYDIEDTQERCLVCGATLTLPAPPIVQFITKTLIPIMFSVGGGAFLVYGLWQSQLTFIVWGSCAVFLGVILLIARFVPNYSVLSVSQGNFNFFLEKQ